MITLHRSCVTFASLRYCQIYLGRKYLNTTLRENLSGGGTLILLQSGGYAVLGRHLVLHRYFGYYKSHKCRQPIINIGPFMIYLVDLGIYYRSKGHWRIKDRTWSCVRSLSRCVCACECNYSDLLVIPWLRGMAFYYHLFTPFTWVRVANFTRA